MWIRRYPRTYQICSSSKKAQGDLAYSNGEFEETSMKGVCEQKCKNVPNESCDDDIGTDPCKTSNDQLKSRDQRT